MSALPLQASRLLAGNRGGVASSSRAVLPRMAGPRRAAVVVPMATAAGTKIELNKAPPSPITLTEGALSHLQKLKAEKGQDKVTLRVGVKSGGCRWVLWRRRRHGPNPTTLPPSEPPPPLFSLLQWHVVRDGLR